MSTAPARIPLTAMLDAARAILAPHGAYPNVSTSDGRAYKVVALDFDDSSHRTDLPTGIAARDVDAVNELLQAMNRRQNPLDAARVALRDALSATFPRGATLTPAQVDVLVGELDATLRRAGGAR